MTHQELIRQQQETINRQRELIEQQMVLIRRLRDGIEKDIDDKLHWYDDSPMEPRDNYIEIDPVISDWWKETIGPLKDK